MKLLAVFIIIQRICAFSPSSLPSKPAHQQQMSATGEVMDTNNSRRKFLAAALVTTPWAIFPKLDAIADDGAPDLTTQLFNPDGSTKEAIEEAKFTTVSIAWGSQPDIYAKNVDGSDSAGTESGTQIRISYQLPDKWDRRNGAYIDKSTVDSASACKRIVVYRPPGKVTGDRLAKATTIGVAEALYVTDELKSLRGADLISGRTRKMGDITFYEYDLAVAPKTCGNSADNLGLGFCPFESIYLLSATVLDDRLYVMALECDKSEWKGASSDLKRVRSSFAVESG